MKESASEVPDPIVSLSIMRGRYTARKVMCCSICANKTRRSSQGDQEISGLELATTATTCQASHYFDPVSLMSVVIPPQKPIWICQKCNRDWVEEVEILIENRFIIHALMRRLSDAIWNTKPSLTQLPDGIVQQRLLASCQHCNSLEVRSLSQLPQNLLLGGLSQPHGLNNTSFCLDCGKQGKNIRRIATSHEIISITSDRQAAFTRALDEFDNTYAWLEAHGSAFAIAADLLEEAKPSWIDDIRPDRKPDQAGLSAAA